MIKAVIFDMDGVLVNSEPYHFEVEKLIFKKIGINISDSEAGSFVGLAMDKMWGIIKERYKLKESIEALVKEDTEFRTSYFAEIKDMKAIEGVKNLIQMIIDRGLKTAVASSSHNMLISTVLGKTDLSSFFPQIVSGFEVDHGKPYPDIFLKTADILKTEAEECAVIEDSYNGVTAAKAAGMKCIGFRNPESGKQDLSASDLIIDSFKETDKIFHLINS